ncbi:MAG: DTW domain-containing protein [Polyangiaceae bacterium]|nr:DTW domain-containing protein [Polyangiaceae bacterium]
MTGTFEPRSVCATCARPTRVCCCSLVPSIATDVRLVVVQHPRERKVPIGTAAMAVRAVQGASLIVGTDVDESAELKRILADPERPAVLLWPGEGAEDLDTTELATPATLVVVDGTWSTAKKLVRRNRILASLPRVRLSPKTPSRYRIRKEPRAECLSTLEAITMALGAIERDRSKFEPMLAAFERMVDIQVEHEEKGEGRRARRARLAAKPRAPLPVELGDPLDWVCVFAEANAFPYGHPGRPNDELLHLVAVRCGDGEVFDAVARPAGLLATSACRHAEIDRARVDDARPRAEVLEAFARFLRTSDRPVSWGTYARDLLQGSGAPLSSFLDLRTLAGRLAPGPVGSLEAASERFGLRATPFADGRAGRRASLARGIVLEIAEELGPSDARRPAPGNVSSMMWRS